MQVKEIWRYPFKSMAGERLERASFAERGMPGDRAYALREGDITRGAKKFPGLMSLHARYVDDPASGVPIIRFEDGRELAADSEAFTAAIHEMCSPDVTVNRVTPASDLEYYRRREQLSEAEAREMFALTEDESFPDMSLLPPRVAEFATPPGTFFDLFPVMIMTTASLDALQAVAEDSAIDVRRFRPNILIDTEETGFIEQSWVGRKIRIGGITLSLDAPCPRCVMTTVGFDDLPKDPKIMRALVKASDHNLGVYAEVVEAGEVNLGDPVELL